MLTHAHEQVPHHANAVVAIAAIVCIVATAATILRCPLPRANALYELAVIHIKRREWQLARAALRRSKAAGVKQFSFDDGLGFRVKSALNHVEEQIKRDAAAACA